MGNGLKRECPKENAFYYKSKQIREKKKKKKGFFL